MCVEYPIRIPFDGIKIWNKMNGDRPMGQVGLGAEHLPIPIAKLRTRAMV